MHQGKMWTIARDLVAVSLGTRSNDVVYSDLDLCRPYITYITHSKDGLREGFIEFLWYLGIREYNYKRQAML